MLSGDFGSRRAGLRAKFIAALALQTLIVILMIVGFEQWRVRATLREQTVEHARGIANTVGSTAGYYVMFGLRDDLRKIAGDLRANPSIEYADFLTGEGKLLAATSAATPAGLTRQPGRSDLLGPGGERQHLFVVPFRDGTITKGYFRLLINERQAEAAARSLRWTNIGVALLALLVAAVLAWFAARVIVHPILEVAGTAKLIAQGDLTQRTAVESTDEIGGLADAFNTMAGNLEKTVTKLMRAEELIKSVAQTVGSRSRTVIDRVDEQRSILGDTYKSIDQLNGGVRKITENVEVLSAASEETSASMLQMVASMEEVTRHAESLWGSVEETASATQGMVSSIAEVDRNIEVLSGFVTDTSSSMVEMSASIAQVETNAARSYDLTLAVSGAAESGMRAVGETIDGMEQIRRAVTDSNAVISRLSDRSAAIGKIVNVIDDIAEQTNLLALNASILAAQAGEHGRGFSVVAAEIRQLSERTAASTREIAALIRSVQEEAANALTTMASGTKLVEQGVSLSRDAGKVLTNILDSASKASAMGKEIAAATREQAGGSENVTRAVARLQELVTQVSAATAQQAQGSDHILNAVESMREVTRYVRQAMIEQKSGSSMISAAADRMIGMIHEIFQVAADQAKESEKIVATMEQVRAIADGNRKSANEMSESLALLSDAIRGLDEEVRKFRVRG